MEAKLMSVDIGQATEKRTKNPIDTKIKHVTLQNVGRDLFKCKFVC